MIEYKTCLVAFIDVMGFKNLLQNNEESKNKLSRFYTKSIEILRSKESIYSSSAPEDRFNSLFVSDSIFLSVEIENEDQDKFLTAARFFTTIAFIQSVLATEDQIWTRGAVSIGPLHIEPDKNIVVGQAFVDAYNLESRADYPRVIIDPKVLKYFNLSYSKFSSILGEGFDSLRLIGVHNSKRLGHLQFETDFVMIDWFYNCISRKSKLVHFFDDLQIRMNSDFELFRKSNLLISYLWESYCRCKFPDTSQGNTLSDDEAKHLESIDKAIQSLL